MQRVYAPVDDSVLEQIDIVAEEKGISRAQWVSSAVVAYLHRDEVVSDADLEEMQRELVQLRTEKEQSWQQLEDLKSAEEKARIDLTIFQSKADKLQAEIEQANKTLADMKEELAKAKAEADKLRELMKIKDDEIAWLRGHVAQITQLALPPAKDEARTKHWWQFWKLNRSNQTA